MSVLYPCQAARVRAWGAQLPEVLTNSFRTETSALFQLWGRRIKWVGSFRLPAERSTGSCNNLSLVQQESLVNMNTSQRR